MPPGMRETLYFKDDDSRLSFLQGNYVTLTNMSEDDIERVIRYHLSPINISFHTTNPKLRCQMLNNRFAGDIFEKVQRLSLIHISGNPHSSIRLQEKPVRKPATSPESPRENSGYA